MNRRAMTLLVLGAGLVLYVIPIVTPAPTMDPAVEAQRNLNGTAAPQQNAETTLHYENLSPAAQQWFDSVPQSDEPRETKITATDRLPGMWTSIAPDGTTGTESPTTEAEMLRRFETARTLVSVEKDGRFHTIVLIRITPHPPLQTVLWRLGSICGAVGLLGIAGQRWLTRYLR